MKITEAEQVIIRCKYLMTNNSKTDLQAKKYPRPQGDENRGILEFKECCDADCAKRGLFRQLKLILHSVPIHSQNPAGIRYFGTGLSPQDRGSIETFNKLKITQRG